MNDTTIRLYHATSADAGDKIMREGFTEVLSLEFPRRHCCFGDRIDATWTARHREVVIVVDLPVDEVQRCRHVTDDDPIVGLYVLPLDFVNRFRSSFAQQPLA